MSKSSIVGYFFVSQHQQSQFSKARRFGLVAPVIFKYVEEVAMVTQQELTLKQDRLRGILSKRMDESLKQSVGLHCWGPCTFSFRIDSQRVHISVTRRDMLSVRSQGKGQGKERR